MLLTGTGRLWRRGEELNFGHKIFLRKTSREVEVDYIEGWAGDRHAELSGYT